VAEETAEGGAENMRDSQFLALQFTRRHGHTPTRTLPESETNFRRFSGKRPPATSFEAATSAEAGNLRHRRWAQPASAIRRRPEILLVRSYATILKEPFTKRTALVR
jgi:hypothetical protein